MIEELPTTENVTVRKCKSIGDYQLCIEQDENENMMTVDIISGEGENIMNDGTDIMFQHIMASQEYNFEGLTGQSYSECKPIHDSPLELCVVINSDDDIKIYVGDGVPLMEEAQSLSEYLRLTHGMELQFNDNSLWDSIVIWENLNGFKKCKEFDNARICASYCTDENRFEMNVSLESDERI